MHFSLFFFPRAMKGKQLKVSFGRGPPGGAVGRRQKHPHRSLSNNIPHPSPPPPPHVRNLCPPPAPGGTGKLSLGVFLHRLPPPDWPRGFRWLSTASLKGTWQISKRRRRKKHRRRRGGERKINFKLTCPTGCQSHFGDTEGCPS